MRRRRILPLAMVLAVLSGILALAGILGKDAGRTGAGGAPANGHAGPELLLRGVDFREVRKEGPQYRLLSDQASYLLAARKLAATGVTLLLQEKSGGIVVRARRALWAMEAGQILLPEGAEAVSPSGWTAAADAASLSLSERLLAAEGRAWLSGPGVTVAGENLVWRWGEGKMEIELPKTRFEPARAFPRKG
ncbi:MAG: hypothetical protein HZA60_09320 [Deltaproteobacteria bacterium]|nr:hypothetical protein [Deltaproteobacteria bacterium]